MKLSCLALSLSLAAFAACSSPDDDSGNGDSSDVGGEKETHRQAMDRCDKARGDAIAKAITPEDQKHALAGWSDCLATANDKAIAIMDATLEDAGSPLAGQAGNDILPARDAASVLCPLLVESSPDAQGEVAKVMFAGCLGERERALGRLLDAWAALDQAPEQIAEDRAAYKSCYEAFDKEAAEAASQNEITASAHNLGTCIGDQVSATHVAAISARIMALFPDQDADAFVKQAAAAIKQTLETDGGVCGIAAQAGENAGGSLARADSGICRSNAATLLDQHLNQFVPEPDGP